MTRLAKNMRTRLDPNFSNFLLQLGGEMPQIIVQNKVKVPNNMLIFYENDSNSLDIFVNSIPRSKFLFGRHFRNVKLDQFKTKDAFVDEVNNILIQKLSDEINISKQGIMEDCLNTLTPNDLPPHELLLKHNCPIMLQRNANPSEGLCNGIRITCHDFDYNLIDVKISVVAMLAKRILY